MKANIQRRRGAPGRRAPSALIANPTEDQFPLIPLNRLTDSPFNVRDAQDAEQGIEELAANIRAQGRVLSNLVVYAMPAKGRQPCLYPVAAGERRRRALLLLVKQKHIRPDHLVPCQLTTYERALEMSLAENSDRRDLHPLDEYIAFKRLVEQGKSLEDIAAACHTPQKVVQQRLKLANVAPEFLAMYRAEDISLDVLMALAATDDHARQKSVWENLLENRRYASAIRQAMQVNEIPMSAPVAQFVGEAAYRAAGGVLREDMFTEDDNIFMQDVELLRKLAREKLQKHADKLKSEGVAWVEVVPQIDLADLSAYPHVGYVRREPNKKEKTKLKALKAKLFSTAKSIDGANQDQDVERLHKRKDEIEGKIEALEEDLYKYDPQQEALAGAVVSVGHNGKVQIVRNLMKPEDAKRFPSVKEEAEAAAGAEKSAARTEESGVYPIALARRLTAHKTAAVQALLIQQPHVALAALVHCLLQRTVMLAGGGNQSALRVSSIGFTSLKQFAPDLCRSKAQIFIDKERESLMCRLPGDTRGMLSWLLERSTEELLGLLAFCVALSADGVQCQKGEHPIDALAKATNLDMHDWWTATADSYFASVSRPRILEIVTKVVSPEAARKLTKMNKRDLAKAAEELLKGKGWLPEILRRDEA